MKQPYKVTITETLSMTVEVAAANRREKIVEKNRKFSRSTCEAAGSVIT